MENKYEGLPQGEEVIGLDVESQESAILGLEHNYWNQLEGAGRISSAEKSMLLDYDNQETVEDRIIYFEERGMELCTLFTRLLSTQNADHINYVLALLNEVVSADHQQGLYFNDIPNCHEPLFSILNRNPDLTKYESGMACKVLALILSQAEADQTAANRFLQWIINSINGITGNRGVEEKKRTVSNNQSAQRLIPLLMALKVMLKTPQTLDNEESHPQITFVVKRGIASLIGVFRNKTIAKNTQTLYVCGFCIWLLSFNDYLLLNLKKSGIVRYLVDTVKTVGREKVVRICFSALCNLLSKSNVRENEVKQVLEEKQKTEIKEPQAIIPKLGFAEDMVGQQLHKTVQSLMQRKWKDDDLTQCLEFVNRRLRIVLKQLSSFEMYAAEAMSGKLRRSPVHTEDFWRNNYRAFEGRQYYLIQKVISFLDPNNDDDTLEMACLDLGEFARFHPDGRRMIQMFHAKPRLMVLMTHKNPAVAKQALLCVQKIMLSNWESLNKSASAGLSSISRSRMPTQS